MKIPEQIWQIKCQILGGDVSAAAPLYGILLGAGIDPQDIVEQIKDKRAEIVFFPPTFLSAQRLLAKLKSLKLQGVRISTKNLKKSDWQDQWKKGVKTFSLTADIDIVPRWTKAKYIVKKKFPIYIDTNLAFGTGLHETTRFMAQLIESRRGQFSTFLDVGTGSGILAIVANYYGAQEITAFDIDRQSIDVAKTNLLANNVKKVRLLCADVQNWKNQKTYDFVAANLVTDDLVSFGKQLVSLVADDKFLAVSGISLKNLTRLQKAFKQLPLKKLAVLRGKEWSALLYKRS